MDRLIHWHEEHVQREIPPEVEAAWLHHRFTQIHPFQDGNGRVARAIASLIFIKANWFPLVVRSDEKAKYLDELEKADFGNLGTAGVVVLERPKTIVRDRAGLSAEGETTQEYRRCGLLCSRCPGWNG